jgi:quercetin dioxygenase-like cupin family protein
LRAVSHRRSLPSRSTCKPAGRDLRLEADFKRWQWGGTNRAQQVGHGGVATRIAAFAKLPKEPRSVPCQEEQLAIHQQATAQAAANRESQIGAAAKLVGVFRLQRRERGLSIAFAALRRNLNRITTAYNTRGYCRRACSLRQVRWGRQPRYCLIDMHIPPGGGPPPHRHDFEEMFSVLEGEIEATFRGKKTIIRAGETINIPANAPHQFQDKSGQPTRMLCLCSPAGQEEFFKEIGLPVATRTTPPPPLNEEAEAAFIAKVKTLARKIPNRFAPFGRD